MNKTDQELRQQSQARVQAEISSNGAGAKKAAKRVYTSKDYIKALAELGFTFRMNAMNDQIEVNAQPITDLARATIRTDMRDYGFKRYLAAIEDAYLAHAGKNQYHPIKDYLTGLRWDKKANIADLAAYFTDADNILARWLKAWLVGACAKIFEQEQNPMLVLDGSQDLGKSFFAEWLARPLPDYFVESPINPEDKDNRIRLMTKWIWEVGELGSTIRKADREALKFLLTLKYVTERKPYHRYDTVKPAVTSFIGTINNEAGFLNDPTGSRRFLVCDLAEINWDYARQVDIDQIWAEAYAEYRAGYSWRLDKREIGLRNEINARYRIESHVINLFLKYFDYTTDPEHPNYEIMTPTADVIETLESYGLRSASRATAMELAAGLKELGIEKTKRRIDGTPVNCYRGVSKRATL